MFKSKYLLLLFFVISTFGFSFSQDLSKLTPEQLEMYKRYMASKGGSASSGNNTNSTVQPTNTSVERRNPGTSQSYGQSRRPKGKRNAGYAVDDSLNLNNKNLKAQYELYDKEEDEDSVQVFGSYLFKNKDLKFETNLNLPTPVNYILGTNDEVMIDISGLYDATYKLRVSPEGVLRIPNIVPVKVGGLTIEAATRLIKAQIAKIYQGVSSGETQVRISLSEIRSVRITVVGEAVQPGTYTLPSLATPFNALYACGGPNKIGTMRSIKVIRHGKQIATLDVYKYLNEGIQSANFCLQDEDVIQIDPYKIRVKITGAIKRPAYFEAVPGEKLDKLIAYAGGFEDVAYRDYITLLRFTKEQKTVKDVPESAMTSFEVKSGDEYEVSKKLEKFDNRVDIKGCINRPGAYALEAGLTVKKLIQKASGVKEDAYLKMAYITRKKENQVPEIIGFNLESVLEGTVPDIVLKKDDILEIKSLFEFREGQTVSIFGAVREPGEYPLIENITIKDLIFKALGFTEFALTDSVELVRSIKDPETLLTTDQKSIVYKIAMDKDMNLRPGFQDIRLENGDQVIVRSISGYEGVRMVKVDGEVLRPGDYNITNKAERISDVIRRSGGLSPYAYPRGAFLIRHEQNTNTQRHLNQIVVRNTKNQLSKHGEKTMDASMLREAGATSVKGFMTMDSIQNKLSGAKVVDEVFNEEGLVNINLDEILKHPGENADLILEEGDLIYIPRELQTVRVIGEVLFPTFVRYERGMSMKDYINSSGGFADNAQKSKVYVLYPNGSAKSTKRFLWFRSYPRVLPGSKILVPQKPIDITNKMSTAETVSILTSITSAIALVYSILR